MRVRRRAIDVWPAISDLLAVMLVILAVVWSQKNFAVNPDKVERAKFNSAKSELDALNRELAQFRVNAAQRALELATNKATLDKQALDLANANAKLAEYAEKSMNAESLNQTITQAMNSVQQVLSNIEGVKNEDQSITFDGELIDFGLNASSIPDSALASIALRLEDFCSNLKQIPNLPNGGLSLLVEGHTDSTPCQDGLFCNWRISTDRAVSFMLAMSKADQCQDLGEGFTVKPVGRADTVPPASGSPRRVTLQVVPNYAEFSNGSAL